MKNYFTKAMRDILTLVTVHKTHFSQYPHQLVDLMHDYDEIHYASRFHENKNLHNWNNLKYPVLDLEETVGKEYADLVYDAWAYGMNEPEEDQLSIKKDKTMDDYYLLYASMKTEKRIKDQVLCTNGNGLTWTKEGFIDEKLPSGVDAHLYNSHGKDQLPQEILNKCYWKTHDEIIKYRKKMREEVKKEDLTREEEIINERKKVDQMIKDAFISFHKDKSLSKIREMLKKMNEKMVKEQEEAGEKEEYYPLCEYALLVTMPDHAHESYVKAGIEICQEMLANRSQNKQSIKYAKAFLKKWKLT